jgi:hypothetical protein
MSWSVGALGKPAAVKKALEGQFTSAKATTASIPEEQEGVIRIEQAVNAQLDFAIANEVGAIKVEASGSFCKGSKSELRSYPGSCQTKLDVQSLYNFVE